MKGKPMTAQETKTKWIEALRNGEYQQVQKL